MKKTRTFLCGAAALAAFICLAQPSAYAYLDPASGSYLLQLLAAFFLGALFSIKILWKNIAGFFSKLFSKKKDAGQK